MELGDLEYRVMARKVFTLKSSSAEQHITVPLRKSHRAVVNTATTTDRKGSKPQLRGV